jgi:hypothetical protein
MTDEQLVHYVEDRAAKAESEGFNQGKAEYKPVDVGTVIGEIGGIKGIGPTKLQEIRIIMEKHYERNGIKV